MQQLDPPRPSQKNTSFLSIATALCWGLCFLLLAGHASASTPDDQKRISIHLENATLDAVIRQIQQKTDTYVLYNSRLAEEVSGLNIHVENTPVAVILDQCLKGSDLEWVMNDNTIVIKPMAGSPIGGPNGKLDRPQQPAGQDPQPKSNAQPQVKPMGDMITGIVTHRLTKEPIQGVVVIFEGTTQGAITNSDGYYSIKRPKGGGTLEFSFLGMETRKIPVTSQRTLDVTMVEKMESIDQIVVTGIANFNKESFTGNTTRVEQEELLQVNPNNVISAIQVFDPSFRIQENLAAGANPNVMPDFTLRGQTGIGITQLDQSGATSTALSRQNLTGNPNQPIFILDGFEVDVEKIYDLDMSRIHSVTILKGAAATAMYGSRAANGVIVIESRAPEAGKLRIQYSGALSVEAPDLTSYNLMNAAEKLETERLAGLFDNSTGVDPYTNSYYERLNNVLNGVDTYWLSQGLRTSVSHKHSLYIDAGENDLRWGLNFNYDDHNGIMKHSSRESYGGEFYIDYRIGRLQVRNKVSYSQTLSKDVPFNSFSDYSHLLPYLRLYDENGNYVKRLETFSNTSVNPLYEVNTLQSKDESSYYDITDNLLLNWEIIKHLKLKGTFTARIKNSHGTLFKDPASADYKSYGSDAALNGDLTLAEASNITLEGMVQLLYNQSFDKHNLNLNLSWNARQVSAQTSTAQYQGFPNGSLSSPNYAAQMRDKPVYSDSKSRLVGVILSGNYTWNNIYLVDIQGRVDGSSEFGANRRWSGFWSTGAGINFHNYSFLRENKTISYLKLRGSYGLTGKTNFPLSAARNMYELQTESWYATGYGLYLAQMGNANLKWERKYALDCGIELGLWKDFVRLKATYYNEKTVDLITDYTIQSSTGFTSYKENMGSVKNEGVELELRLNLVRNQNWNFSVYGNFSHNENRIVEISDAMRDYNKKVEDLFDKFHPEDPDQTRPTEGVDYSTSYVKYYEGASMTSIYGMHSLGISPTNGKEIYIRRNGDVTDLWSADEWSVIGDTAPKGQGSFGFNLSYKQLSLFASFLYQFGGDKYNYTLVNNVENANIQYDNVDKRVLQDRWQKPGDISSLKDIKERSNTTGATSRFVQKDNTLEFNSLSISYDINPKHLRKAGIGMCRFTATMNNIFYISSIRRERGLDYPFSRMFNLTVNLSF